MESRVDSLGWSMRLSLVVKRKDSSIHRPNRFAGGLQVIC